MADTKISALPSATTPLAGTEVVPIVQSGVTDKVTVGNLTAGRAVAMLSANVGTGAAISNARLTAGNNTGAGAAWGIVSVENCGGITPPSNVGLNIGWNFSNGGGENNIAYGISAGGAPRLRFSSWNGASLVDTLELMANNDVKVSTQNIVQGTAAKGINFTANTPAAGMTSRLLNWYEEGTWTPNQGGSVSVVGAYSSSGSYTRVGRTVTVTAIQSGATSISTSPSGQLFTNLPFTVGGGVTRYSGMTALQFTGATGAVAIGGTTNVYCCGSLSGGDTIVTTITYEV